MSKTVEQHESLTIEEALRLTEAALSEADTEEASVEARWIVAEVLGIKMFELFMNPRKELTETERSRLGEIVRRRERREPLAYITGLTDFRGHLIKVSEAVLIPRPETELIVDEALSILAKGTGRQMVLEPCTGSGCIAVALSAECEAIKKIVAIEIDPSALAIARENALRNNVANKIDFLLGDLLEPVKKTPLFDLIVANPPYIPRSDMEGLAPEVRLYEPYLALCGGLDGMDFIKRLIQGSAELLRPGGSLLLELGIRQALETEELARADGCFEAIGTKKDLSGIERIFSARRKGT